MKLFADMHVHSKFSVDGTSTMEEYCLAAEKTGSRIICFTEHVDFNSMEKNLSIIKDNRTQNFVVDDYFCEINRLRKKYSSLGGNTMREHDLELLRIRLQEIKEMGWVRNQRPGNAGGVGNTLEDLLDVAENNLQLPDFGDWELKSQRAETGSLLTLFHSEPKPRNARIVPQILLPLYGWPHQDAGTLYPMNERSFRQTINATSCSDRGFMVNVDWDAECIFISFDYRMIDDRHAEWRRFIRDGVGTGDIDPNPYWTFADISQKLSTKLNNLMYVKAETRYISGHECFKYNEIEAYVDPTLERFLDLVEAGAIYVDFDARTGHNHGTKFRIRPAAKTDLYQQHIIV